MSFSKNDRPAFEEKWQDLSVFIKYGMLSDEKFHDRVLNFTLVKTVDDELYTIEDFKEKVKATQTDKNDKLVFIYTNNPVDHDSLIAQAKNHGYEVLVLDNVIDNHFIQHLEHKLENISFVRVDAETIDNLIQKDEEQSSVLTEKEEEKVQGIFNTVLEENKMANLVMKALAPSDQPVVITRPEFMRRMKEMQSLQGMQFGDFPEKL